MHSRVSFLLIIFLASAGCATLPPPVPAGAADVAGLSRTIRDLGDDVDWNEADRAAQVAFEFSRQLAVDYAISDSPLLHNLKVNLGLRERGLCIDWTYDMLERLQRERFKTLDLHWAIANSDSSLRLEHSTAVISRRGGRLEEGVVLDPWRNAGRLHWAPIRADTDYLWRPREEVLAEKRRRKQVFDRLAESR